MTIFQELKRRNVIRVGALYLVAAWLLLQLTDVLSSLLPVPEWTGSLVFLLLAIGFLPVMLFAWVYEMTPEGLKREADIDRSKSITSSTGHKINTVIIVLLVLAISGLVADRLIPETSVVTEATETAPEVAATDDTSIAVLPFADLSADKDQQYFTDGLSEELLNLLVRVNGLRVASRTSSFAYRDSTLGVPNISKALNVGHVLEGSVRKDGDRIRITAQLIEAGTDSHLWSENFDRELVDIFAIQDEIANAIVGALAGQLNLGSDKAVTVEAATDNLDAYEMYLAGRELYLSRIDLGESIRLLQAAVELDPNFARAWEGLAAAEIIGDAWLVADGIDHLALAEEAANRALVLNPDLSMPMAVLAILAQLRDKDVVGSLELYEDAIARDPKNTTAWLWKGILFDIAGFMDEAIEAFQQCLAIDPGYLNCKQIMAKSYLSKGDIETALRFHNETLEHVFHSTSHAFIPTYVRTGHRLLAVHIADAKLGHDNAPVIEWIRAIENPDGDNSAGYARLKDWERRTDTGLDLHSIYNVFLTFKDYDELVAGDGTRWLSWLPEAEEFRASPQFKQFIVDSGIFAFWQSYGFPPQCRPIGDDNFAC
jgi:TolB-like protein